MVYLQFLGNGAATGLVACIVALMLPGSAHQRILRLGGKEDETRDFLAFGEGFVFDGRLSDRTASTLVGAALSMAPARLV